MHTGITYYRFLLDLYKNRKKIICFVEYLQFHIIITTCSVNNMQSFTAVFVLYSWNFHACHWKTDGQAMYDSGG